MENGAARNPKVDIRADRLSHKSFDFRPTPGIFSFFPMPSLCLAFDRGELRSGPRERLKELVEQFYGLVGIQGPQIIPTTCNWRGNPPHFILDGKEIRLGQTRQQNTDRPAVRPSEESS